MRHNINQLTIDELRIILKNDNYKMNEIIRILKEYEDLYLPEPEKKWDIDEFKIRVYERTAIEELITCVRLNLDMTFGEILDAFRTECSIMFDCDTPNDVFEILRIMCETIDNVEIYFNSQNRQLLL